MQRLDSGFVYSATDLNNFIECRRLTDLAARVALGELARPEADDEQAQLLRDKGQQHEDQYLARLEEEHDGDVVRFPRAESGAEAYREAERQTLEAMRAGRAVIYQATFFDGQFLGHADFLRRVETPSDLGAWSYDAVDTKLALSTKPYFILQLCNYSEHLARLQGRMPDRGYIVFGNGEQQAFTLRDYLAYYRRVKAGFLEAVSGYTPGGDRPAEPYPNPIKHCGICPWNESCDERRTADDHLSLVAWMRQDQIGRFEAAGITTVAELAATEARPEGMEPKTFAKLQKQAMLQVRSRASGAPVYELLPHDERTGFGLLPAPAPGDVYFDMEGDPMFEPGRGLEYLFGCWLPGDPEPFKAFWGLDRAGEKVAFEQFIDFVRERRREYPGMHVYHYAPYEKTALRRLAQEHSTRVEEIDELLRGEVLVDLYAVVRQTLMIGEDSYSIKRLERFYGMQRATEVKKGDQSIVMFEKWRVDGDDATLRDIENYNRDDCESTYLLHMWLLERRREAQRRFECAFPFRSVKEPDAPCHAEPFEGCKKCTKRVSEQRELEKRSALETRLLRGIDTPLDEAQYERKGEAWRTRYLIGHLLSYHRREEKPFWWEYFDRCDNVDRLREFDKEVIGELELCDDIAPFKLKPKDRNPVYTYRFPDQRYKLGAGDAVHDPRERTSAGRIVEIDDDRNLLRLKRGADDAAAAKITALIPGEVFPTTVQRKALVAIAEAYVDGTLEASSPAIYDLLAARTSRVAGRTILQPEELSAATVSAVVRGLQESYLFIQGPPGSGKSTIASAVIADLLAAGKRVGVVSNGHKAIHNLLHKVEAVVRERGGSFSGRYKCSEGNPDSSYDSELDDPFIVSIDDNKAFEGTDYDLAGGTAWLFAREELCGTFDFLFIDEAGQMALANALAVARCAKNVVLLGDPSQLAQVSQGTHAPHVGDSVLVHLLGHADTIPPDRGIFLDVSHRMHPEICDFISGAMYDGRLRASKDAAAHHVTSAGITGSGLRYLPIEHFGNGPSSEEEADAIVREVSRLRAGTVCDTRFPERPVQDSDIIVVTPYNAQRRLIERKLQEAGFAIRVGTVDKFQGQEAPIVFYSMATSSADDVPRDVDFLFDKNRFNVAVSRARAISVLVCCPRLLDMPCQSAEQMALLNFVCTYVEQATILAGGVGVPA